MDALLAVKLGVSAICLILILWLIISIATETKSVYKQARSNRNSTASTGKTRKKLLSDNSSPRTDLESDDPDHEDDPEIQDKAQCCSKQNRCCLRVWKVLLVAFLALILGFINGFSGFSNSDGGATTCYSENTSNSGAVNSTAVCTGQLRKQDFYRLAMNFLNQKPKSNLYPIADPNYMVDPETWRPVVSSDPSDTNFIYNQYVNQGQGSHFASIVFATDFENSPEIYYDIFEDLDMNYRWNALLDDEIIYENGEGRSLKIKGNDNFIQRRYAGSQPKPSLRYQSLKGNKFLPNADKLFLHGHEIVKFTEHTNQNPQNTNVFAVILLENLPKSFNFLNPLEEDVIRKYHSTFGMVIGPSANPKANGSKNATDFMIFTSEIAPFSLPSFLLNMIVKFMVPGFLSAIKETADYWRESDERLQRRTNDEFYKQDIFENHLENIEHLQDVKYWRTAPIESDGSASMAGYCYDVATIQGDKVVEEETATQKTATEAPTTTEKIQETTAAKDVKEPDSEGSEAQENNNNNSESDSDEDTYEYDYDNYSYN